MENENKLLLLAQDISIAEDNANPVFMQIKMRVCNNAQNRNGEGVTASFISSVANNKEQYNAIPLYCDVKNLLAKNYRKLGHMYVNGKFYSTQIGALTEFYSETDDDGITSLYATARVPKRETEICACLYELFLNESLSFSFEVRFNPEHCVEKEGVRFITDNPDNCLTGVAVVSVPAYESAVALDLVAEQKQTDAPDEDIVSCAEQDERGEEQMEKENLTAEVNEEVVQTEEPETETVVAETTEEVVETATEVETVVAEEQEVAENAENDQPIESAVAETQEANAEVLEHSVDTHESIEQCPYSGEPVHVIEYHERIIETMEDAGTVIAELEAKVAELEEIKSKYDAMVAEAEAKILAEKKEQAKAFAEKQGLDMNDTAVAEAVENLDYAKIAELTMAQVKEDEPKQEEKSSTVTLASFVELNVSEDKYGGLLSRRNN